MTTPATQAAGPHVVESHSRGLLKVQRLSAPLPLVRLSEPGNLAGKRQEDGTEAPRPELGLRRVTGITPVPSLFLNMMAAPILCLTCQAYEEASRALIDQGLVIRTAFWGTYIP